MLFSSILDQNFIYCNVEGSTREEIYSKLLTHVSKQLHLNINDILDQMINRENSIQMPYEMGLALPHCRSANFDDLYIVVGTLKDPVQLKENDTSKTSVIMMSLISQSTSDMYLKALSAFARFLTKPENLSKLVSSQTPRDIVAVLEQIELKKNITAEDIMTTEFPSISVDAPITEALNLFTRERKSQLPVVDSNHKLIGLLDASDIIAKCVPHYIMQMDNINFLNSFEPFEQLLNQEESLLVKDYVHPPACIIKAGTQLIQFTLPMVKKEARNLLVVDDQNTLIGIVTMQEIINKVLRG